MELLIILTSRRLLQESINNLSIHDPLSVQMRVVVYHGFEYLPKDFVGHLLYVLYHVILLLTDILKNHFLTLQLVLKVQYFGPLILDLPIGSLILKFGLEHLLKVTLVGFLLLKKLLCGFEQIIVQLLIQEPMLFNPVLDVVVLRDRLKVPVYDFLVANF